MKDFDPVLIDYLLGSASVAESEALEQRLENDPELRQQIIDIQEVVVHHSPNVEPLNSNVRSRILTSVSPATRFFGYADRLAELFDLPTTRISELLQASTRFPEAPWEPSLVPDMLALHFDGGDQLRGVECGLVHLKPGTAFPNHDHEGDEVSFILQGELTDHLGDIYLPGDVVNYSQGQSHSFTATGDTPLVFAVYHNGIVIDRSL